MMPGSRVRAPLQALADYSQPRERGQARALSVRARAVRADRGWNWRTGSSDSQAAADVVSRAVARLTVSRGLEPCPESPRTAHCGLRPRRPASKAQTHRNGDEYLVAAIRRDT